MSTTVPGSTSTVPVTSKAAHRSRPGCARCACRRLIAEWRSSTVPRVRTRCGDACVVASLRTSPTVASGRSKGAPWGGVWTSAAVTLGARIRTPLTMPCGVRSSTRTPRICSSASTSAVASGALAGAVDDDRRLVDDHPQIQAGRRRDDFLNDADERDPVVGALIGGQHRGGDGPRRWQRSGAGARDARVAQGPAPVGLCLGAGDVHELAGRERSALGAGHPHRLAAHLHEQPEPGIVVEHQALDVSGHGVGSGRAGLGPCQRRGAQRRQQAVEDVADRRRWRT